MRNHDRNSGDSAISIQAPAQVDPVVQPSPPLAAPDVAEELLQLGMVIGDVDLLGGRSGAVEGSDGTVAAAREGKRKARPLRVRAAHFAAIAPL